MLSGVESVTLIQQYSQYTWKKPGYPPFTLSRTAVEGMESLFKGVTFPIPLSSAPLSLKEFRTFSQAFLNYPRAISLTYKGPDTIDIYPE